MLRNYLLIAFRAAKKNLGYTFISIFGLAIGLAVCLLILLYVREEYSYDQFHENADRIFLFRQFESGANVGGGFANLLRDGLDQPEEIVRLMPVKALLSKGDESFYEENFFFADSNVFKVFTFPLRQGDPETALEDPYSLILTREMADKYFPGQDPVGQTLQFDNGPSLTVTGVLAELPGNSHLEIDFLANYRNAGELVGQNLDGYWDARHFVYVMTPPGRTKADLEAQIPGLLRRSDDPNANVWDAGFIPLRDIYLRESLYGQLRSRNAIQYVWIFSAIALLVLLLACFNYINLATARATVRAQEVGIRKTMGARRSQLMLQFLGESFLFTAAGFLLAILIVQLSLPFFNQLSDQSLRFFDLLGPGNALFALGLLLVISLLTGAYPAVVLSRFRPIAVLRDAVIKGSASGHFRRVLVTVQFTVSAVMIIATLAVVQQMYFIQNKDLGYQREQVLLVPFEGKFSEQERGRFSQSIEGLPEVRSMTFCSHAPGLGITGNKLVPEYLPEGAELGVNFMYAGEGFLETFGIDLADGRTFRTGEEGPPEFLINEKMVQRYGWERGAGRRLAYYTYQYKPDGGYEEVPREGEVVGVVKDFHQLSLRNNIQPILIVRTGQPMGMLALKLQAGRIGAGVNALTSRWERVFPDRPFAFEFLDESFDATYRSDVRTGRILTLFAVLAVLISCLGLLGLAAFTAQQRTKEIGIRKVMGASVKDLVLLLNRDFLRLLLVAMIIGAPVAYYLVQRYLEEYAYHIELPYWSFAAAVGIILLVGALTVSYHSLRAATANPADSLKYE